MSHHELCFGCGQANLFGLQLELTRVSGGVEGRFFVKQDHQGEPGFAHTGVLTAALEEAISLAGGGRPQGLRIELLAAAPVGTFIHVRAEGASATASDEGGRLLARAAGTPAPPRSSPSGGE